MNRRYNLPQSSSHSYTSLFHLLKDILSEEQLTNEYRKATLSNLWNYKLRRNQNTAFKLGFSLVLSEGEQASDSGQFHATKDIMAFIASIGLTSTLLNGK